MELNFEECQKSVARAVARLCLKGLATELSGSVSVKSGEYMFITPSGRGNSSLSSADIAMMRISDGEILTPRIIPSKMAEIHRACYLSREDVGAAIISCGAFTSLFSSSDKAINTHISPECYETLGEVRKIPWGSESAKAVYEEVGKQRVFLLEHIGALAASENLISAFDAIEKLEMCAKMTLFADSTLSEITALKRSEIDERMGRA